MRLTEPKQATRNGDASNHIVVRHQVTNCIIDWDSAQCFTNSTTSNYFQQLTRECWYSNLEQMLLNRCQSLSANIITTKLTNHFHWAGLITPSTDKHSLKMISTQVVKMSFTNNSSFQNYPHPDDYTTWTTEWYSWVQTMIVSSFRLTSFILPSAMGITNVLLTKNLVPICKKADIKIIISSLSVQISKGAVTFSLTRLTYFWGTARHTVDHGNSRSSF